MFVIFGWSKTAKPQQSILRTYCYHCNNNSSFSLWRETEWVSLFFIKVLPFIDKRYLCCDTCGDATSVERKDAQAALDPTKRTMALHDKLIVEVERNQLSGLTEGQLAFRKSMREEREG